MQGGEEFIIMHKTSSNVKHLFEFVLKHSYSLYKKNLTHNDFFFIFQGLLYYCLYTELIDMGKPSQFPVLSNILYSSQM